MHSAPAVTYPVGRSRFHACLLVCVSLSSFFVGLLWRELGSPDGSRQVLLVLLTLGFGLAAAQVWRRTPQGSLCWDGQNWSWTVGQDGVYGLVAVYFDLQICMVLNLRTDGGDRIWLWPERSHEPTHWNALRRAVFSHVAAGRKSDSGDGVDTGRTQVKS